MAGGSHGASSNMEPDADPRRPAVTAPRPKRAGRSRIRAAWERAKGRLAPLLRRVGAWTRTPAARAAAHGAERLGRAGYVAKGTLYAMVGGLAIDAGVRPYDALGGARDALVWVQRQWLGQALVGVLAAGLLAYVCWQIVQAALDPLERGRALGGVAFRAVCLVSAALYGALAVQGIRLLAGAEADADQQRRALLWMRTVLDQPLGRWALLAVGVAVLAYAAAQILRAVRGPGRSMDLSDVSDAARRRVVRLAGAGLAARGVVAAIIAWFIVRAAVLYRPGELLGVAGALRVLRDQPQGPTLLVVMGAGLAAYGVLQGLRAYYWDEPDR